MDSLDPAGPIARRIDSLFWLTFWVAVAIFFVVEGAILVAAIFFRDRPKREEPKQTHGNPKLEVAWTVVPILILAALAVPTVKTVFDLTDTSGSEMTIEVIGHQWWFEYVYRAEGITTANVLVIPEDTQVALALTSDDVIHNFWVPRLNGKRYAVPGQVTTLLLQADDPGEYWGQCGEFCGLSHSLMRARVQVLTAAAFDQWVADQQLPAAEPAADSLAAHGLELFQTGLFTADDGVSYACTQCHVIAGVNDQTAQAAPNLTHFASRNVFAGASLDRTAENVARWLSNPPAIKPGSYMPNLNLSQEEITSLVAYLETLN
ncbi:MAG: cytochrome c oxidase subunit II [Acidimicrobiia bacterium]